MISISYDLLASHFGATGFSRYELQLEPQADVQTVRAEIDRITAGSGIPVQTFTGDEFLAQLQQAGDDGVALVAIVFLVLLICASVAVLNTMLASVLERTTELAALRAVGATRRRIMVAVGYEAAAMGMIGSTVGAVFGAVWHLLAVRTVAARSAWPIEYSFRPDILIAAIGAGVLITAVAALVPGRRAARLDILTALARPT